MLVKTHLIVTGQSDNFKTEWKKSILSIEKPILTDGLLNYVIVTKEKRVEMKELDPMKVEKCAKKLTWPRGRGALTTDLAKIYVKTERGEELIGIVTHNHIRDYAPMFDEI